MRKSLLFLCVLNVSVVFCQLNNKNEISFRYLPSVLYQETASVKYSKMKFDSYYVFNQVQVDLDRRFLIHDKWSIQTGLSLCFQQLYFKRAYDAIHKKNNGYDDSFDNYFQPTDWIEYQLSLNLNLQLNYSIPSILNHTSYIDIYGNYNGITFYNFISNININRNKSSYAGTHLHWALFKEPTPRTSFLILGLNYEFYNTPRLYNYRIFATVGLAVQFGKKREKE